MRTTLLFKYIFSALLALIIFGCAAVKPRKEADGITIASWNVENLFDTEDDPMSAGDDSYTPKGWVHWTENRYQLKLEHLADVIAEMKPDIIGLAEVENRRVLDDLNNTLEKKYGFKFDHIVHRDSTDYRGIDVAIMSKLKPVSYEWYMPEKGLRDIAVADFELNGKKFTVMMNHWKSRLGKKEEGEMLREKCAQSVREAIDAKFKKNAKAAIIVMGDFNDDPDSRFVKETEGVTMDLEEFESPEGRFKLYYPAAGYPLSQRQTYYYAVGDEWSCIDQFHVSHGLWDASSGLRLDRDSFKVYKYSKHIWYKGSPMPFRRIKRKEVGDTFKTGYSDHYPIIIKIDAVKN